MGAGASSSSNSSKRAYGKREMRSLREKVRQMQEEIASIMKEKERESKSHRRDAMAFATKDAEWRKERRKLREEIERLRTKDQSQMEMAMMGERMREERARRDETVEKWKQLYLTIKTELDDLIRSARYGWKAEEEEVAVEDLKEEMAAREETIASLRSRAASLEQEKVKLEREVDILRQSLRIISSTTPRTKPNTIKNKSLP